MAPHREQLLDAIGGALSQNRGASMQEIADAAGISRATLHRTFGGRDQLMEAVCERVLAQCDQLFDEAGIDSAPVGEALDRLLEDAFPLYQSYWLFLAAPHLERVPHLLAEIEAQDDRFERFCRRAQRDGVFRADVPARWLVYSIGSQVMAAHYAVEDGHVGPKQVPGLVKTAVLEGVMAREGGRGGGA